MHSPTSHRRLHLEYDKKCKYWFEGTIGKCHPEDQHGRSGCGQAGPRATVRCDMNVKTLLKIFGCMNLSSIELPSTVRKFAFSSEKPNQVLTLIIFPSRFAKAKDRYVKLHAIRPPPSQVKRWNGLAFVVKPAQSPLVPYLASSFCMCVCVSGGISVSLTLAV